MNKKSGSGSSLFLMEMIVVVFFFVLCASICIAVFVKANNLSRLARDTNQSVIRAESIAEALKGGRLEELLAASRGTGEDGSYRLCWDGDWRPVEVSGPGRGDEAADGYEAVVTVADQDGMKDAAITIIREWDQKELYSLQVKKYDE